MPAARTWTSLKRGLLHRFLREVSPGLPYVNRPEMLRGSNKIKLLRGGAETFPAMLDAIAGARRRIHLETYILYSDRTGKRFQEALVERARQGVEVRVIYDSVGCLGVLDNGFVKELAAGGVEVVEFHPIAPWRPRWGLNRRDHQKLLIVDGEVGFTGGINIGDPYAPPPEGEGWYDLHARVEGPVVHDLALLFRRTWVYAGGRPFPEREALVSDFRAPDRVPVKPVILGAIHNWGFLERHGMNAAWRFALRQARRSIDITNAYFLPDILMRREFRRAVRRGVSVRVIVPAVSDVAMVQHASRHLYDRLLRAGVRMFEYQEWMMHAKAGVVDGEWATIGSYNVDRRSFLYNLEVALVIADRDFALELAQQFERDLQRCREVRLEEWRERPLAQRALQWLCFRFRYWL